MPHQPPLDAVTAAEMAGVLNSILRELRELRGRVERLSSTTLPAVQPPVELPRRYSLTFEFLPVGGATRTGGKTFTHQLRISGDVSVTTNLSLGRTALLLVLLADYKRRQSGATTLDVVENASEIMTTLSAVGQAGSDHAALRAQIARLASTGVDASSKEGVTWRLGVSTHQPYALRLWRTELGVKHEVSPELTDIHLEISDPTLSAHLDGLLPQSILHSLRRKGVLYVSGGPAGFDTLFSELFDHEHHVTELSMFFKPSIITYPPALLNFIEASEQDRRRQQTVFAAFKERRVRFVEVLNVGTLADMITRRGDRDFHLYGPGVTAEHVCSHLEHIAWMLTEFQGAYELILTERTLPFLFSTFRIERPGSADCVTTFFRQLIREHDPDVECFAICDEALVRSLEERVLPPIVNSPDTIRDVTAVRGAVLRYRDRLRDVGPLEAGTQHEQEWRHLPIFGRG